MEVMKFIPKNLEQLNSYLATLDESIQAGLKENLQPLISESVSEIAKDETIISDFAKVLKTFEIDMEELEEILNFNPRATKLAAKGKTFIVIAIDEPYFKNAFDMIREREISIERWTDEDQAWYLEKIGETGEWQELQAQPHDSVEKR